MALKAFPKYLDDYGPADWANAANSYYVMLITGGSYNAAHSTVADGLYAELVSTGYAKVQVTSRDAVVSGANVNLTGSNAAFGNLTGGAAIIAAILVRQIGGTPNHATDRLAGWLDGGSSPNDLPFTPNGGPFTVAPSSSIWMQLQT